MKIVYDFRIFSLQRHGGISRYFIELARRLGRAEGVDASICAPFYVNHHLRESAPPLARGLYLKKLPARAAAAVRGANELLSRSAFRLSPPDILHETYFAEKPLAGSRSLTVTTVYDMIHELYPQFFPGDETARLKRAAVARAQHVFCISRKTQEDLIRLLGVPEEKTSVVHLGCDFAAHKPTEKSPLDSPYLLFVGPRGGHKNFTTLLTAYAASAKLQRDFRLVCFGSSPFSPAEAVRIRALGLGAEQVLHRTGEDSRLPAYYAHASIFVYPSLYEGFGFPPLEAMAMGCPTVASRSGSIPEVLGAATEYFAAEDAEELKAALERVAYSASRRAELSRAGVAKVAEYPWEKCAERTLGVYRALIQMP